MKLYRAMKINNEWEIVSNKVLYERNLFAGGNVSGLEYMIHQEGSPDGSVSILNSIACYTKEEAIDACRDFLKAKIDSYQKAIETVKLEIKELKL